MSWGMTPRRAKEYYRTKSPNSSLNFRWLNGKAGKALKKGLPPLRFQDFLGLVSSPLVGQNQTGGSLTVPAIEDPRSLSGHIVQLAPFIEVDPSVNSRVLGARRGGSGHSFSQHLLIFA